MDPRIALYSGVTSTGTGQSNLDTDNFLSGLCMLSGFNSQIVPMVDAIENTLQRPVQLAGGFIGPHLTTHNPNATSDMKCVLLSLDAREAQLLNAEKVTAKLYKICA
jgi:hypothetical protein